MWYLSELRSILARPRSKTVRCANPRFACRHDYGLPARVASRYIDLRRAIVFARIGSGFRAVSVQCICLLLIGNAAAAQTAEDIMKKMNVAYGHLRSFDATITTEMTGTARRARPACNVRIERVQYQRPNRFYWSIRCAKISGARASAEEKRRAALTFEKVCDGRATVAYSHIDKKYRKRGAPSYVPLIVLVQLLQQLPYPRAPGLTLQPGTVNVNGRRAYVIDIKPVPPARQTPAERDRFNAMNTGMPETYRLLIDAQNFTILQYGGKGKTGGYFVEFSPQVLDGKIPAQSFTLKLPAGATEYQGPLSGAPDDDR